MFSGAVLEKRPAIPRMLKKHRGFHRGTLHRLGSSLSHCHGVDLGYRGEAQRRSKGPIEEDVAVHPPYEYRLH
jgi:hypothetical protein